MGKIDFSLSHALNVKNMHRVFVTITTISSVALSLTLPPVGQSL